MKKAVFCIVPTIALADSLVLTLKSAGFVDDDISVLFPDRRTTRDFAHEAHTKAPEGAAMGAGIGGIVGGAIGLLAGIGAIAVPGLGLFIAAGPLMGLLGGVGVGASALGLAGLLVGLGIPEIEAKRYENKLRAGNVLISVHVDSPERRAAAKRIFEAVSAKDIGTAPESLAPKTLR